MARDGRKLFLSLLIVVGVTVGMRTSVGGAASPGIGGTSTWQGDAEWTAVGVHHALPMFVEGVGQFQGVSGTHFQLWGVPGSVVWVTEEAIWVTLLDSPSSCQYRGCGLGEGEAGPRRGVHLRFSFAGANPRPLLIPFSRLATRLAHFRGGDPTSWHHAVPVWGGVRYVNLYPGVDLEVEVAQEWPRGPLPSWQWVVHPDAPPNILDTVRLRVEGAKTLRVDEAGQLEIVTELGLIHQGLPEATMLHIPGSSRAFQGLGQPTILGTEVVSPYVFAQAVNGETVQQGSNDALVFSTFLGGGYADQGCALAVDAEDGSVVVSGATFSPDFPVVPGVFDPTCNGSQDVFVARLSADGSTLLSGTFLGGGGEDGGRAVAVDPRDRSIVVAGATRSPDFPTTPGAFDPTYHGDWDAFVARLSADGDALLFSTFLGGEEADKGWGMALHPSDGTAILVGRTLSPDFPTTPGAFDPTYNGDWDAFLVRLGADGKGMAYGTYLGGSAVDYGEAVVVNPADGTVMLTGGSFSPDFPTTPDAFDPSHNGLGDAIVARLSLDGGELLYSTFVGGSHHDEGHGIAVDPSNGTAIIVGGTMSSDFPTTAGAFDPTFNGGVYDAFVAWLDEDGHALCYSTFLGGEGADYGAAVAVNSEDGTVTVTGPTTSPNFPITPGAFTSSYSGGASDTFVTRLSADSSTLLYSTFLGGGFAEWSWGLAVDPAPPPGGTVIVVGYTYSPDFPTTPQAIQPGYGGAGDAFVAKMTTVSPTVHVHAIHMLGRSLGTYHVVLSLVRVMDRERAPVSGALVEAVLTRPDGSTLSKGATTNAEGYAVFWVGAATGGVWMTCVEDIVAAGYVYDASQDRERCDSLVYP